MNNIEMIFKVVTFSIFALIVLSAKAGAFSGHGNVDSNGWRILKEYKMPLSGIPYAWLVENDDKIILTDKYHQQYAVYYTNGDQTYLYRTGEYVWGDQTMDEVHYLKRKYMNEGMQ